MDRASRAALLSALVFPGVGHCYLGRWWRGLSLALASLVPLYLLVSTVFAITRELVAELESGALPPDLLILTQETMSRVHAGSNTLQMASLAFAVFWVAGIVDAHRLGSQNPPGDPPCSIPR
ncbi:hypothetical protein FV139_05255 [Parahaliea maris]|uniref:Uncharacterized protein n=1 Tax=Parahaliea maris TaxID=2716870 RepID=A0A5C9A6U4_9GAMM|nr:hypothetical protein [Parahaliea maris]TXS95307.1 hypothetical protein FV139_05255 [Parahaliea maris]